MSRKIEKVWWERKLTYEEFERRRKAVLFDAARHCLDLAGRLTNQNPQRQMILKAVRIIRACR